MKNYLLVLFMVISNSIFAFKPIVGKSNFTDQQLRQIEKQAFEEFGIKVTIEVMSRNASGEIQKVKITVSVGKGSSFCESDFLDEFHILKEGGCWIKDKPKK